MIDIKDRASLQELVKTIHKFNESKDRDLKDVVSLRAVGGNTNSSNHYNKSYSITTCTEADILIQLTGKEFHAVHAVEEKPNSKIKIATIGASTPVGTAGKILNDKYKCNITTASLVPYISVAGLMSIGANGTGRRDGGFCEGIVAITFCTPDGDIKLSVKVILILK